MGAGREDAERLLAELHAVREIGTVLTSTLDLPEVLQRIMEQVSRLLNSSRWSMLLTQEDGRLRFETVVGKGSEALRGRVIEPGEGLAGWAVQQGAPVRVEDPKADPRWADEFDSDTGMETTAILAVPVAVRDRVLGVIELVAGPGDPPFDDDSLRILSCIADYAAIAIDNARNYERLQSLTVQDEHTGLFNARYLYRTLEIEIERATRYFHPLSMVFLDLDHFKQVNDQHGHLAGSAVLREVGTILFETCRGPDVPCRYGGDEFVVLLPETGRDGGVNMAQRLRHGIRSHTFLEEMGLRLRLTASFGVASYPDDASDGKDLIRCADLSMYRAKAAGRDSVAATGTDPSPPGEPPLDASQE